MGGWDWLGGGWETGLRSAGTSWCSPATSRMSGHWGRRRRQAVSMSRRSVQTTLRLWPSTTSRWSMSCCGAHAVPSAVTVRAVTVRGNVRCHRPQRRQLQSASRIVLAPSPLTTNHGGVTVQAPQHLVSPVHFARESAQSLCHPRPPASSTTVSPRTCPRPRSRTTPASSSRSAT